MSEKESGAESATVPAAGDINERVAAFNVELKVLLGKYELGLGAEARITDKGLIVADPRVLDARGAKSTPPAIEQ